MDSVPSTVSTQGVMLLFSAALLFGLRLEIGLLELLPLGVRQGQPEGSELVRPEGLGVSGEELPDLHERVRVAVLLVQIYHPLIGI